MTSRTVLAFDFGLRRVGVAVGETALGTARELDTVTAKDGRPQWPRIDDMVRDWQPAQLVVGLPGGDSSMLKARLQRFGAALADRYNLPLYWVDERLTSDAANLELKHSQLSTQKRKAKRDQVAARLILETWLNQLPGTATDG